MKKLFLILVSCFLLLDFSYAQNGIQWQKCLGGLGGDNATSVQQTADGGYIVAGYTESNDGDVTGNHGYNDCWVVKLDSNAAIQWQKCLGGTGDDEAYSVQQTADGGYIVAGFASSNDGDVTGNHGQTDYWIVKLNSSGNVQWQKCLGGTGGETATSVQQTADGGYVVIGYTYSIDGDVTGNHTGYDYWIVKLNSSGNIQWKKCLGGVNSDYGSSVQQTADGGYIVAGNSTSNDGDVTGNHGGVDEWVAKLDNGGNIQWQKSLGGTGYDEATFAKQTADGGYIVAGCTYSNNGDITGYHGGTGGDFWVVKLDGSGNIQWQKCLGGTADDRAYSVQQTLDGGYVVAGYTTSNDGDVTGFHGYNDYWVVKLNSSGNIQGQKCLGGTLYEGALSVDQTTDGGFIVAGRAESNNGDVSGVHGSFNLPDYWVVKLSPNVGIEEESGRSVYSIFPNPFTSQAVISFSSLVHNATFSLYNLLGEKVAEVEGLSGESFELTRGNLKGGVYFFDVREKGKSIGRGKAVVY